MVPYGACLLDENNSFAYDMRREVRSGTFMVYKGVGPAREAEEPRQATGIRLSQSTPKLHQGENTYKYGDRYFDAGLW